MATSLAVRRPVLPTDEEAHQAQEGSRFLAAYLGSGQTARLRVIFGDQDMTIPLPALRLLEDILTQMSLGNAVTIVPYEAELTTQQAADFLNVSRPHLVSLLERGELPFRKVGTHRRVSFKELLVFREKSLIDRKKAADELTRQAQELDMGY